MRTGSQEPFEEIVRRYAGMVFNVCYQILRDTHDAEDATQAVFLTLAVKSRGEDGIKYLAPWLQKVAQRLSLDVKRSKTRRKVREERHSVMREMNAGDGDTSREVDLDEVKVVLRDELDKLPAKYRLPLILHYFGGLKPEEMARELGCKPSTLGVRLHRGRKLLAENLQSRGVSVSGTMLGATLAIIVRSNVHSHLIQQTSYAATQVAAGNTAGISAQVLGFNKLAEQGMFAAKIKAAVAAAVMLATAACGAAQFVAKVKPFAGFDLPGPIRSIFEPLLRTLNQPIRTPMVDSRQVQPQAPAAAQNVSRHELIVPAPPVSIAMAHVEKDAKAHATPHPAVADHNASNAAASAPIIALSHPTITWPAPTPSSFKPLTIPGAPEAKTSTPAPAPVLASDESITIGGGFGTSQSVTFNSPTPLTVRKFIVGGGGTGYFHQTGGLVRANELNIGEDKGGKGMYTMTGGSAVKAGKASIGGAGDGTLAIASSAASFDANHLSIGRDSGSHGTLDLSAGQVTANDVAIGDLGSGVIKQTGGEVHSGKNSSKPTDGLVLALKNGSEGLYDFRGGHLYAGTETVAASSIATFKQTAGSNNTSSATIGSGPDADGTYKLTGGVWNFRRAADSHTGLIIGNSGTGALALGDGKSTGKIYEAGAGAPISAVIRASDQGDGRIYGYGAVRLHGSLDQNGKIIADGYGKPRDLDLTSFSTVTNTIDNSPGGDNGYFARHGGRLLLPAVDITAPLSTVTWGEQNNGQDLDLINSARFTLTGVDNPGKHSIALMAPDRPDVPPAPAGVQFASIWHGDFAPTGADSIGVTLRYDDTFSPGIAGSNVQLWTFSGDAWQDQSALAWLDVTDGLISATVPPSDWFAVSTISSTALLPHDFSSFGPTLSPISLTPIVGVQVPEPASVSLIALASVAIMRRRKRSC